MMRPVTFKQLVKIGKKFKGPRILCVDIETFPIEAYVWALFKQNVGLNQIKTDWAMMSFSAEWLHDDGNFYVDNRRQDHVRNDRHQLTYLWELLDMADFVIARNGKKFDLPKIKARMAINGFKPFRPVKMIDPLLLNRDEFGFTSQKLEYTTSVMVPELRKSQHSKYPGFELWAVCLMNDLDAWKECEEYNRQDVVSMKAEYLKLRGWYSRHPNLAIYMPTPEEGVCTCSNCASTNTRRIGEARTQVGVYAAYVCDDCGHWGRARKLVANMQQRAHVLVS